MIRVANARFAAQANLGSQFQERSADTGVELQFVYFLILLSRTGFSICEVGVQMRESDGASMHAGHRSLYYVYKMSLSIFVTLLRRGSGSAR